jgi:hypothetical protein
MTERTRKWAMGDKEAVSEVEWLLRRAGLTIDAVMAQTLAARIDDVERIDRMATIAEARRDAVLRGHPRAPRRIRAGAAPRRAGHRRRVRGRGSAPGAAGRNGRGKSTGPTSAVGKARPARNARKHGLNVPVTRDPDLEADVALMATQIAPGCQDRDQDVELIGRARRIAEAQVDLIRIARARRDIISAAIPNPGYGPVAGVMEGGTVPD